MQEREMLRKVPEMSERTEWGRESGMMQREAEDT